jgi:subtilisin family serine protease
LVVVLSLPAGLAGGVEPATDSSFIVIESPLPLSQKIDASVRAAFEEDDYVEALVKLTRQVDTEKVARAELNNAPSPQQGRTRARAAVVERLRENASTSQAAILRYLEQEQSKGSVLEFESFYIVNLVYVKATSAVIEQLARRVDVKLIMPNSEIHLDPPQFSEPSGFSLLAVEWGVERVKAPDVWALGFDGESVVVGVMDTGVYWQHEALKEKWRGYNPDSPNSPNSDYNWFDATIDNYAEPFDGNGHGTHVTGTVLGSSGDNQIGVAPGAKWIAARIFDSNGSATSQGILSAGQFMLAPHVGGENLRPDLAPDIINNSWGSKLPGDTNEWFRDMVKAWRNAGILPVFAAGNDGEDGPGSISCPANYPESFAVAAIGQSNNLAYFSSLGPGYLTGIKPEISAPGMEIRSSLRTGGYGESQGTSMAAPHIAGVAALLLSANPDLNVDQVQQVMIDTAVPLTNPDYPTSPNYGFGYGLVDALAAVESIQRSKIIGRVLAEGIDNEAPTVQHQQDTDTIFAGYGFPVEATVSDNVAVTEVKVLVKAGGSDEWDEVSLRRIAGDHQNGEYWGAVPWELVQLPGLEYKIAAFDFSGNRAESSVFSVEVAFGLTPGWSENFSEEPVFWDRDGDWEWGIPGGGISPRFGSKVMATKLEGNYSNNSESFLWAPPLDLRNAVSPYLRLDHRYDIETIYDAAVVGLTGDYGQNWEFYAWDGDSQGWQTDYIDLNPFKGSSNQVYVVFFFISDNSVVFPGWYLDQVSVVEVPEDNLAVYNFEADNGGFEEFVWPDYQSSWQWGVPTSGPGEAYSGQKLWATRLNGDYLNNSRCVIRGPEICLNSDGNNYLSFQHCYNIESEYDYGYLVFFINENEFYYFEGLGYTGVKEFWSLDSYPLDWLLDEGCQTFRPGFLFESDGNITRPGWYIDDLRVYKADFDISTAVAGMEPLKMTLEVWAQSVAEKDVLEEKPAAAEDGKQAFSPLKIDIDRHIPFRQPLQGPEPLIQPLENPLQLLPVAATLSVSPTGISGNNNPADGTFTLFHPGSAGEQLTLHITSPGYLPAERTFTLAELETVDLEDIILVMEADSGDVDQSGGVDVGDAIIVLRHIVGLADLTPSQWQRADVNLDGTVDVADAILILRYIVELVPSLPIVD